LVHRYRRIVAAIECDFNPLLGFKVDIGAA
jgi:hypothetical protein